MTRSLLEEAKREVDFALQVLEAELDHASREESIVQRIEPVVADFAQQVQLSSLDVSTTLFDSVLKGDWTEVGEGGVVDTLQQELQALAHAPETSEAAYALRHSLEVENRLPQAIEWLQGDLAAKITQAESRFDGQLRQAPDMREGQRLELLALAHKTRLVREYSDMWTIYRVAVQQHQRPGTLLEDPLAISDYIAHELYAVAHRENLRLNVPDQVLIAVFFKNEAFTRPSRTAPLPYIVIPRWALRHMWIGNAIAHEVGHNILWNVEGLFDELLVLLVNRLTYEGFSYDRQRIWGRWIEEMFADTCGAMLMGPAAIRSQERLLVHVPRPLLQNLSTGLVEDVINEAREAYDTEHPISYLRAWLSIEAFKILTEYEQMKRPDDEHYSRAQAEIDDLEKTWCRFFGEEDATKPQGQIVLKADGPPLKTRRVSANAMLQQGRTALKVMLFTPLHALASGDGQPRPIVDVFYHKPEYEDIDNATNELLKPQFSSSFFTGMDLRTVLAAAEYAFEQGKEDELSELSNRLVAAINQTRH
jgi:chaperone required for assembly of F1-ATPase